MNTSKNKERIIKNSGRVIITTSRRNTTCSARPHRTTPSFAVDVKCEQIIERMLAVIAQRINSFPIAHNRML